MSKIRCPFCGIVHPWPKLFSQGDQGWLLDISCSCGSRCRGFDESSRKIIRTLLDVFGSFEGLEGPVPTREGDLYLRIDSNMDVHRDPATGKELAIHLLWTRLLERKGKSGTLPGN